MNTNRIWILGASDPEMSAIENLLRACGETVQYAEVDGQRVHPGNAYRCPVPAVPEGATAYAVECIDIIPKKGWVRIDHHRPGDPGYGRPPEDFMTASSIGQVIAELARLGRLPTTWRKHDWTPGVYYYAPTFTPAAYSAASPSISRWIVGDRFEIPYGLVLAAAADHCLAHAYAGDCPGVDPDALMRWRAETRAAHQWAPAQGLVDIYGDPARGFAGGYLP